MNDKAKGEGDHLTPSNLHMPLCTCIMHVQFDLWLYSTSMEYGPTHTCSRVRDLIVG
jgi:hypothetical protein